MQEAVKLENEKKCHHHPKIFSYHEDLLDLRSRERMKFHLGQCSNCQAALVQLEKLDRSLKRLVPAVTLKEEQKSTLLNELSEVIDQHFSWREGGQLKLEALKNKIILRKKILLKDIFKIFFAKDMVKYYFVALILGAGLKFFKF